MNQIDLGRYSDLHGEQVVLAHLFQGVLVDDLTNRVEPHMFFNDLNRALFQLCLDHVMGLGRGQMDANAVVDRLRMEKKLAPDIQEFINGLRTYDLRQAPAIDYLVNTLSGFSKRRRLIVSLQTNLGRAMAEQIPLSEIVAETEEDLLNIDHQGKDKIEVVLPKDILVRRERGLIERIQTTPVFSGWDGFDKLLSVGFAPTKLSIIAGRTSMGKSFFKTNLLINMARAGVGIINICPEQGFDSEHDRLDSIMTGIHLRTLSKIRDLQPDDAKFQKLKNISETISKEWNYACVPTRGITVNGVRSAIHRARRGGLNPQVVFVDLFDRLEDVNVAENRTANISQKLGQIEKIAQEEKVHMCLLVQINRGTENRKDHRPGMGDLRDCGNFEQDADLILLLYREGYYNKDLEDNILDVEIAKQRDGTSGVVYQFMITSKETLSIAPMGEKRKLEQGNAGQ